jgi:hypothetical protein
MDHGTNPISNHIVFIILTVPVYIAGDPIKEPVCGSTHPINKTAKEV